MLAKLFSVVRAIYPFMIIKCTYYILLDWDSAVGIATHHRLDGLGIEPRRERIFRTHPDRLWGPPSLLYNGYRVFPGGKAAGA